MIAILTQPEPQTDVETDAEDEAILAELWEEIQHLRELMDADQVEIERLQSESRQLKSEAEAIMIETRAILSNLSDGLLVQNPVAFQMQRNADNERHEREKMALRMEITLLRLQQGLPPAPPDTPQIDS